MDKFLEKYNFLKLNQEEAESLDKLITAGEIEASKTLVLHKSTGPDGFTEVLQNIGKPHPAIH